MFAYYAAPGLRMDWDGGGGGVGGPAGRGGGFGLLVAIINCSYVYNCVAEIAKPVNG